MRFASKKGFDHEAAILEYVQNPGVTPTSIARRHGMHISTLSQMLKKRGLRRGTDWPGPHGIVNRRKFAALYASMTIKALAMHLGCTHSAVIARAQRMGLPPKTAHCNAIVDRERFADLFSSTTERSFP